MLVFNVPNKPLSITIRLLIVLFLTQPLVQEVSDCSRVRLSFERPVREHLSLLGSCWKYSKIH